MTYPESLQAAGARLERWDAHRHLAALLVMADDEAVQRFLSLPRDEAGLAAISERFAEHWATHAFGLWAVRLPETGPAGWVGACHPRWHPEYAERVELAWGFTAAARGRGIATAGARVAAAACFESLGLDDVIAFIDPQNGSSRAVADRLGMRRQGETVDPRKGTPLEIFTLSASDLRA